MLDLLIRAGTAACPEDRRQTDDARGVSSSIAAVDVVAADDATSELLRDVVHFVGGLRAAEHPVRAGRVAIARVAQRRRRAVEGFVPRGSPQIAAFTYERMRQSNVVCAHGR